MPHVTNNGIKINYEVTGRGEPLVMLHPNGHCIQDWHTLGYTERLGKHFQLILIDGRGFGDSDKPHDVDYYRAQLIASDTIAVMDELDIAKAHCFGYSMGGRNAFALMNYYPQYFNSFIIGGAHPYSVNRLLSSYTDLLHRGLESVVETFEKNFGLFPLEIKSNFLKNDVAALLAINSLPLVDFSKALASYSGKVSLIVGEKDPAIEQVKKAQEYVKSIQVNVVPNKNHMQLFFFSAEIASFLLSHAVDI